MRSFSSVPTPGRRIRESLYLEGMLSNSPRPPANLFRNLGLGTAVQVARTSAPGLHSDLHLLPNLHCLPLHLGNHPLACNPSGSDKTHGKMQKGIRLASFPVLLGPFPAPPANRTPPPHWNQAQAISSRLRPRGFRRILGFPSKLLHRPLGLVHPRAALHHTVSARSLFPRASRGTGLQACNGGNMPDKSTVYAAFPKPAFAGTLLTKRHRLCLNALAVRP